MTAVFYISACVAVVATALVITRSNAIHALLYLIVSLLAVAIVFFSLGAPLIAAFEVIIYAGAIMVLFVFIIMLLNLRVSTTREIQIGSNRMWIGPGLLVFILASELSYILGSASDVVSPGMPISPEAVGLALFGTYVLGVELTSILLLVGLVGAYHLGRRPQTIPPGDGTDGRDSP